MRSSLYVILASIPIAILLFLVNHTNDWFKKDFQDYSKNAKMIEEHIEEAVSSRVIIGLGKLNPEVRKREVFNHVIFDNQWVNGLNKQREDRLAMNALPVICWFVPNNWEQTKRIQPLSTTAELLYWTN